MKRTTRKSGKKAPVKVVRHDDHSGLLAYFAEHGQLLAPMLELIATGKQDHPVGDEPGGTRRG